MFSTEHVRYFHFILLDPFFCPGFAENVLGHIRELLSLPVPDEDPMLAEAIKLARAEGKISSGLMQGRLKISYARAARLLDMMEEQGVIGPAEGNAPRELL